VRARRVARSVARALSTCMSGDMHVLTAHACQETCMSGRGDMARRDACEAKRRRPRRHGLGDVSEAEETCPGDLHVSPRPEPPSPSHPCLSHICGCDGLRGGRER
jgi:hypothetical protein